MVTEDRLKRIRASICLLPDPGYEVARELLEEIARLREGLRLITCESVNAEYMAQNILDGLPAYHDTMLVPNETPNAELCGARRASEPTPSCAASPYDLTLCQRCGHEAPHHYAGCAEAK